MYCLYSNIFFIHKYAIRIISFASSKEAGEALLVEEKCYFGFHMNVNFKLSEEDFFMISISKIVVPL